MGVDAWAIWFYSFCVACFLLASALNLNSSCISIYHSLYGRGAPEKPLIGQPHWIRMDEWDFQTPAILNQTDRLHPFRVKNTSLGAHSISLFGNIPVAHITAVFRPQFWAFFILPSEYAFAMYWQFKALILVTGVFTWLLLITRSTLWSATGSLWYFFSPCTQWTYSWNSFLPEMVGSLCFAMVLACYLTVGKSSRNLSFAAVGFAICTINFSLCAYPPHMLPFIWLAVLFFVGWLAANRKAIWIRNEFTRTRVIAVIGVACVIFAVSLITLLEGRAAIQGVANTVYPGKRIFAGASVDVLYFLGHFFDWFTSEQLYPPGTGNICEAAGFLWLAPIALFCTGQLRMPSLKRNTLIVLSAVFSLFVGWLLIPLPPLFGRLLALDRTGGSRPIPALGLVNIAIVVLVMSAFKGGARKPLRAFPISITCRAVGVLSIVALLGMLTDQSLAWIYNRKQLIAVVIFTTFLTLLILHGSRRLLPILLVLPSALVFGTVNPIEHGLAVITSSAMYRFVRTDPDYLNAKWLVFSDSLWDSGFLTATGCAVYDGLHFLPDIDHFALFASRGLDVKAFNQDGYLLAHPISPTEKISVRVIQAGWTRWNVSPVDPILKQLGIKFVAFDQKPASNIAAPLVPLSFQPVDNYWLYRIP